MTESKKQRRAKRRKDPIRKIEQALLILSTMRSDLVFGFKYRSIADAGYYDMFHRMQWVLDQCHKILTDERKTKEHMATPSGIEPEA